MAGFTLLEMMLTVFLIGLAAGLVALNVERDNDDIASLEARRFAALVVHLQDESVFTGLPMGIEVRELENLYRFWRLEDSWQLVDRVQVLREREVPDGVVLQFRSLQQRVEADEGSGSGSEPGVEGESQDGEEDAEATTKAPRNLLVVEPTGLIRPFIATFRGDQSEFNVSLDNELNPVVSRENI
jgi:prepilin-type N-terminal cleavage/methylation domain-containing protein